MKKSLSVLVVGLCLGFFAQESNAVTYVKSPPLTEVVKTAFAPVKDGTVLELPIITWGGDIATIYANGNQVNTASGSLFDKEGLKFKIVREDVFPKQLEGYISGKTPYLRGTLGQINMASELLSRNPRLKPIAVYNHTRSTGGDCLVVKAGINTIADLRGKKIVAQVYGPHVEFIGTVLKSAGLTMSDVTIVWTKDLTGTSETPGEAFKTDNTVDACFVISTDANLLTSGGKVGDGSEGSVKGAKTMFSTKVADKVIFDTYFVSFDYFTAHQEEVQKFVHALLVAEESLSQIIANPTTQKAEFDKTVAAAGKIILDSDQAKDDILGLYGDCTYVGYLGNVKFFATPNEIRRFQTVTEEIQTSFIGIGLLSAKVELTDAGFDYESLKKGLTKVVQAESPRFVADEVSKIADLKSKQANAEIFSFEILFQPNQKTFNAEVYRTEFDKAIELSEIYGGAIITVEGHSDPSQYIDKKVKGDPEAVLRSLRQSGKNLSMNRAIAVRESLLEYGKSKNVTMDPSQFATVGLGFENPKTGIKNGEPVRPKDEKEWLSNMRVVFKLIPIGDTEAQAFTPAGGGK